MMEVLLILLWGEEGLGDLEDFVFLYAIKMIAVLLKWEELKLFSWDSMAVCFKWVKATISSSQSSVGRDSEVRIVGLKKKKPQNFANEKKSSTNFYTNMIINAVLSEHKSAESGKIKKEPHKLAILGNLVFFPNAGTLSRSRTWNGHPGLLLYSLFC